jgi:peptide/nickel transport system substrate-binding protein
MNTAFMQLRSGSIDIFPYLDPEKADQIRSDFQILSGESNMVHVFALNNREAPFDNPKVREAVNYAVDRTELIQILMDGEGTPIYSGMSPAMGPYFNESLENAFPYDPDRAIALLEEAGFPEGFEATVTVPSNYQHHVNAATVIADQLSRVGIDLSIVSVDWATWLSQVYADREFQSTVIALTSEFSPRDVLSRYVSNAKNNFINYSNPEFDRVFAMIQSETDEAERIALYRELQQFLTEDGASVFFEDPRNIVAVRNELSGYVVYPIYVQDMSTVHYN